MIELIFITIILLGVRAQNKSQTVVGKKVSNTFYVFSSLLPSAESIATLSKTI